MVMDAKQYELNRIVDLIKNRQYQITSSQIQDQMIMVTAEKEIKPELATTKDLEATWITNFLKSFGWDVESTSFQDTKIIIHFVKTVLVHTP